MKCVRQDNSRLCGADYTVLRYQSKALPLKRNKIVPK